MRASLDLADAGLRVFLIEQTLSLGGRVAQLGFMFPQHDCVLCRGTPDHGYGCTRPSISPAFNRHNQHPNINILTNTRVVDVEGQAGDFTVSLRQEPRFVDNQRCVNCGLCTVVCPVELPDSYQQGMSMRKAAYKVASRAAPDTYVIDHGPYCDGCRKCAEVCPTHAIRLDDTARLMSVDVGAIILALGFKAYDPGPLEELGYGRFPNVISAMQYERLASRSGPTEGTIRRPSDHRAPRSVAWLQCIGSRDQTNPYCSSICCMYATKEAVLARQRLDNSVDCEIFIMDERAFNKEYNAYFEQARNKHGIRYHRSRISQITEDPETQDLIMQYADPDGTRHQARFEMVVLSTGLQPPDSVGELTRMLDLELNEYGFCQTEKFTPLHTTHSGVFVCGAFASPKEISETIIDASGAAGEVMHLLNGQLYNHAYSREWPFLSSGVFPEEKDVSNEAVRVGVFACTCGGAISDTIDVRSLIRASEYFEGVTVAEVVDYACLPETLAHIQAHIEQDDINRIVIAGCSSRTHESLFQRMARSAGLNPYLVELVNLRDHCARVHHGQPELACKKALELVRMALGRVDAAKPIHKNTFRPTPVALVIGGGLSGMTSALTIADSGYEVVLVERSDVLGGNLQDMFYVAEGVNPRRLGRDLINRIRAHKRITALVRTEMIRHHGHVGEFWADLRTTFENGDRETFRIDHGIIILATGAQELRDHHLLKQPGVITQRELEEMIVHHPEKIAALKDVVMIQCVRSDGTPDYCSRVCCTNTLKNAIRLKLFNPGCSVSILYKNIVTYGFREKFYTEARKLGVLFIRYTDEAPPEIVPLGSRHMVRVHDLALDRDIHLPADLVPLSMPVVPSNGTRQIAEMLHLPLSTEGFFEEAQLKLRPMDFMKEGVFLAGMAHYPKFIEESISHAQAAAARALTVLSQPTLHVGGVVAQVDPDKCVGCLTCARTCPFGIPKVSLQEGLSGVGRLGNPAYIDPAQCQGCGTCTGECPANAIQLLNYTDDQIMLKPIQGLGSWVSL